MYNIKRENWNNKTKLDVSSAWRGLEEFIPSIITNLNINPEHCLEFGVDLGYSTHIFSQLFNRVTGIDSFEGDPHILHEQNIDFYSSVLNRFKNTNVEIIKTTYQNFIKDNNDRYDLIHVDIVHFYKETFECTEWAINHSDVVLLHDTVSFPEIYKVCEDISKKYNTQFYNIPDNHGLGILFCKK